MTTTYDIITEQMIKALEAGTVPWQKPWSGGEQYAPANLVSGKRYRGINVFLLGLNPAATTPYWLTFNQAKQLGGSVRKGEHGTMVVFFKELTVADEDSDDGKPKRIPMLRYYKVFNLDQCEGVRVPKNRPMPDPNAEPAPELETIAAAEAIVSAYPDPPTVAEGTPQAFYSPSQDHLNMPSKALFDEAGKWYATLFHELGHSTGHVSRLDRFTGKNNTFGCKDYGREELVAEMTAAFLCAEAGITATMENSAAYLASWIKTIREDTKAVVVAAGRAQKAADWIQGHGPSASMADPEAA